MNDVQDGHENSKDCKGETEGCQWHVLDELCSDWSCLSFLPASCRVSFSPTFSLPALLASLPSFSYFSRYSILFYIRSVDGSSRWTNKPSCKRKRGETETDDGPVTRGSGRGRVCEINNFHGPSKNNTRSVTRRLRKRLLRSARRRDALSVTRISPWIFFSTLFRNI